MDNGSSHAKSYAKQAPMLEVCDAIAQTAKHHTRRQSGSPITAIVVKLYDDQKGIHADVEWNGNAGVSGRDDALALADRCIESGGVHLEGFDRRRCPPIP